MTIEPITIPAYAADTLGETLTVHAPANLHHRVRALSAITCYGPNYSRSAVEHLQDASRLFHDYPELALEHLQAAESHL